MAWRRARSLLVLESEVQTLHPGTTVWDIGDEAHRGTASDHNPNAADVVCATDTLDNAGLDLGWYAERVRQAGIGGHPAPKYVIYNRRIASRSRGWAWRAYGGSNPHTGHVHVSAGIGPDGRSTGPYDDTSPWGLIEEDDVSWQEELWVPQWIMDRWGDSWPDRRIRTGGALISGYGHSRVANENTQKLLRETRAGFAAVLAQQSGQDVAAAVGQLLDEDAERERQERAAELAELRDEFGARLDAAAQERTAIAELVASVGSGEQDARAVVDEIARRLEPAAPAGGEPV